MESSSEALARKFDRTAEAIAARMPRAMLDVPPVSREEALDLSPDDSRWKRRRIEDLRVSAYELRESVGAC